VIPDNTDDREQAVAGPSWSSAFWSTRRRGFLVDPTRSARPGQGAWADGPDRGRDCFGGEMPTSIEQARDRDLSLEGTADGARTTRMPLSIRAEERRFRLRRRLRHSVDEPVGRDRAAVAKSRSTQYLFQGRHKPVCASLPSLLDASPAQGASPTGAPRREGGLRMRGGSLRAESTARRRPPDKLLAGPLPWTRMRRAYALLGLARRYGSVVDSLRCRTRRRHGRHPSPAQAAELPCSARAEPSGA
jgi:hypothetical protein